MNRQTPVMLTATAVLLAVVSSLVCGPKSVVADAPSVVADDGAKTFTKVVNIKDFGAIGDGVASETDAIQDSIDACHDAGGGVVRVPAGDFQFGTIVLKSNVTLSLDYGANLLGSTDKADYRTEGIDDPREGGPHCLIYARFRNNNYNNDGLDLDGCEDVLIENCDIDSGDDAICLKSSKNPCRNIVVRGCKVSSNTAPLKFGASSRGGFIDVKVTNCYFYNSPMGAIKLQLVDGGRLENVEISRIAMDEVGCPIFIRLGDRGNTYGSDDGGKPPVGTLKNIRISDVVAEVTIEDREETARAGYKNIKAEDDPGITDKEKSKAGPIMITGIPGHRVENVTLQNVKITFPGHGTIDDAGRSVPEDVDRYPEQFFFGVLPSWGAYIRHANNVEFVNVKLEARTPDARKRIFLEDVEGFVER